MKAVDISIIMACRNEASHIVSVLDSMLWQERIPGLTREFVIADGMSDDGTFAILKEYEQRHPEVRVMLNTGRIVSTGLNSAIRGSTGKIIVRMDAHTEYAPCYVRRCVEILQATGADNVGGPARTRSTGWLGGAIAAAYHSRFACGGAAFHDSGYEGYVDTVPYGCWTRELFERIGLFDETLVRNQDDEFNLRTIRSGGKIWQSPVIMSWYSPRSTIRDLFRQYFQYGFWKVAVVRKHRLPASWRHLVPSAFVSALMFLPIAALLATLSDSPARQVFWMVWLMLVATYFTGTLVAALAAARQSRWSYVFVLPVVFTTYHTSYGLGFLLALTWHARKKIANPDSGIVSGLSR
jgi:glycosyltransferase involved in cell wall biosynthesis